MAGIDLFHRFFVDVVVPRPVYSSYSYLVDDNQGAVLKRGSVVRVPFGRGTSLAYVIDDAKPVAELESTELAKLANWQAKLKPILEVVSAESVVLPEVWKLAVWARDYYFAPWGDVLSVAAPSALFKGTKSPRKKKTKPVEYDLQNRHELSKLNDEQRTAYDTITADWGKVTLLEGVTGSGKTEVYLSLARKALDQGKTVLILVPEIALTPQLHERFIRGLQVPVGLWHSVLADGERKRQFQQLFSGEIRVLIGVRSSVFAPIRDLGLIIVDEEHDTTYKQEDRFRYHSRDLAVVRGKISGCEVVLGSATPSLETRQRVIEKKYRRCVLTKRFGESVMPIIDIVDLSVEPRVETIRAPFAERTLQELIDTIKRGEQAMVFLNRRGFAAFLICEDCGETTNCPHCSISLAVHFRAKEMRCHLCGHSEAIPSHCEKCRGVSLSPEGAGTESLEDDIEKLMTEAIPGTKVVRLDRDQMTSATRLETALSSFRNGESQILVGTQMLVKGHDFPNVTLVVVVLADSLFRFPDFRAAERAYQILTQVSGRAGRGKTSGRVLIQTFCPEHPALEVLTHPEGVAQFIADEQEARQILSYPPFSRLARIRIEKVEKAEAEKLAESLGDALTRWVKNNVVEQETTAIFSSRTIEILGPSEAFIERLKGLYRFDITIKSAEISPLQKLLRVAGQWADSAQETIIIDVDPSGLG